MVSFSELRYCHDETDNADLTGLILFITTNAARVIPGHPVACEKVWGCGRGAGWIKKWVGVVYVTHDRHVCVDVSKNTDIKKYLRIQIHILQ